MVQVSVTPASQTETKQKSSQYQDSAVVGLGASGNVYNGGVPNYSTYPTNDPKYVAPASIAAAPQIQQEQQPLIQQPSEQPQQTNQKLVPESGQGVRVEVTRAPRNIPVSVQDNTIFIPETEKQTFGGETAGKFGDLFYNVQYKPSNYFDNLPEGQASGSLSISQTELYSPLPVVTQKSTLGDIASSTLMSTQGAVFTAIGTGLGLIQPPGIENAPKPLQVLYGAARTAFSFTPVGLGLMAGVGGVQAGLSGASIVNQYQEQTGQSVSGLAKFGTGAFEGAKLIAGIPGSILDTIQAAAPGPLGGNNAIAQGSLLVLGGALLLGGGLAQLGKIGGKEVSRSISLENVYGRLDENTGITSGVGKANILTLEKQGNILKRTTTFSSAEGQFGFKTAGDAGSIKSSTMGDFDTTILTRQNKLLSPTETDVIFGKSFYAGKGDSVLDINNQIIAGTSAGKTVPLLIIEPRITGAGVVTEPILFQKGFNLGKLEVFGKSQFTGVMGEQNILNEFKIGDKSFFNIETKSSFNVKSVASNKPIASVYRTVDIRQLGYSKELQVQQLKLSSKQYPSGNIMNIFGKSRSVITTPAMEMGGGGKGNVLTGTLPDRMGGSLEGVFGDLSSFETFKGLPKSGNFGEYPGVMSASRLIGYQDEQAVFNSRIPDMNRGSDALRANPLLQGVQQKTGQTQIVGQISLTKQGSLNALGLENVNVLGQTNALRQTTSTIQGTKGLQGLLNTTSTITKQVPVNTFRFNLPRPGMRLSGLHMPNSSSGRNKNILGLGKQSSRKFFFTPSIIGEEGLVKAIRKPLKNPTGLEIRPYRLFGRKSNNKRGRKTK